VTDAGAAQTAPDGRRILLLIGAVGAGKGTQAERLEERLGIPHLASGDLFRAALRDGTPLGERARVYMDRGDLVPDEITIEMFMERLSQPDASRGAILDGFPRTVGQAAVLDATLAARGERIAHAIYIAVTTEELVQRVAGRSVCPICGTPYHDVTDPPRQPGICDKDGTALERREDDRPEVVRARLEKQVPPMLEVVDYYRGAGILTEIDGQQPIDAVTEDILQTLKVVA
jgi:adenylate kinase